MLIAASMYGCTAAIICMWSSALISSALTKLGGQLALVSAHAPEHAVGIVLDDVLLLAAVGHPLLADVGPGERGLDAARRIARRTRARSSRSARSTADASCGCRARGSAPSSVWAAAMRSAAPPGTCRHRRAGMRPSRRVAPRTPRRRASRIVLVMSAASARGLGAVVAQAEHRQRVAHSGETEADAALVGASSRLLGSGHSVASSTLSSARIDTCVTWRNLSQSNDARLAEGIVDETRQVDRAEAAAADRAAAAARRRDWSRAIVSQ